MKKHTTKALITSLLSMLLCVSMLIGSTFAWFTDTATTGVNTIVSGNLDVALEVATAWDADGNPIAWENAEGGELEFRKAAGAAANEEILWEPGCTYVLPEIRVINNGNLWLKYQIRISGIDGDAKLNEVIEWTYNETELEAEGNLAPTADSGAITIKGHMKEEAGNEYKNLTIDGIAITVLATQKDAEFDSFDNEYDEDAEFDVASVSNEAELYEAVNAGKPVILANDITLEVPYINVTLGTAETENISINGNGHTITFNNGREEVWVNTVNPDAVLSISNAKLVRANNSVGNYLTFLSFYCNTNLTDVEFNDESANLWGVGKTYNLTGVKFNDTRTTAAHYSMFIQSGNTVTMDGCAFNTAEVGNRAIKVSDVNAEAAAQAVTNLTVKNTTFASNKKAAILVGTKYGANITLENVDITKVAADSTNAVWVEDVYAAYADTVVVTGGTKIIEQ